MKKQLTAFALVLALLTLSACGTQSSGSAGDASSPDGSISVAGSEGNSTDVSSEGLSRSQEKEPSSSSGAVSAAQTPDASQPESSASQSQPDVSMEKPVVSKEQPQPSQPEPQTPPETQPAVEEPKQEVPVEPQQPQEPVPVPAATREDAMAYIGQSAASMIAAIGKPNGSSYAPSCMGDGEDGELYYDGFTVYTYRENGTEIVQDVL